jgi:dihydrofolate reductase
MPESLRGAIDEERLDHAEVLVGRVFAHTAPAPAVRAGFRRRSMSPGTDGRHTCTTSENTEDGEMGEIHVHEFMSADGVIDAPVWTFEYGFHPRMGEAIGAVTERSAGILLGRTTYEMFEPAWSTRTVEDDPGAPFFNDTTKYVVSGTLREATWRNSEIVGPYDAERIRALKDEVDGDLYVSGSGTLVRAMLDDGLVDGLHLFVYPLTRGDGPRLFPDGGAARKLSLEANEAYDNGVVYLHYRPR